MGCWSNFTILQTFLFPASFSRVLTPQFEPFPGQIGCIIPQVCLWSPTQWEGVGEKPPRGGGREVMGYWSLPSSASEDCNPSSRAEDTAAGGPQIYRHLCEMGVCLFFWTFGILRTPVFPAVSQALFSIDETDP